MYIGLHVNDPVILSDLNPVSWADIRKKAQVSNFIKIRPVFHTDGRTDMTNLIVAFRNFANAPKQYATSATAIIFL